MDVENGPEHAPRLRLSVAQGKKDLNEEIGGLPMATTVSVLIGLIALLLFYYGLAPLVALALWLVPSALLLVMTVVTAIGRSNAPKRKRRGDVVDHGMKAGDARFWGRPGR